MCQQDSAERRGIPCLAALLLLAVLAIGCAERGDPLLRADDPNHAESTIMRELPDVAGVDSDEARRSLADGEPKATTVGADSDPAASDGGTERGEQPVNEVSPEEALLEGPRPWAVVVAGASDPYDPLLEDAVVELRTAGWSVQITNCDVGAANALQMSPTGTFTVSVYYDSHTEALEGVSDLAASEIAGVVAPAEVSCPG